MNMPPPFEVAFPDAANRSRDEDLLIMGGGGGGGGGNNVIILPPHEIVELDAPLTERERIEVRGCHALGLLENLSHYPPTAVTLSLGSLFLLFHI